MATSQPSAEGHLSLTPMGAGDLIDRAVRFYRNNFGTFVAIATPPVLAGALFSVAWTLIGRGVFSPATAAGADDRFSYYVFTWFGNGVIWLVETIATLVVMGGASRNFVRHLLFGEPISFKETYRNTAGRFGGLLAASTAITISLGTIGFILFYFGLIITTLSLLIVVSLLAAIPLVATIISVVLAVSLAYLTLWLFFLIASRFAYVPQVMLVEGQGVFSAVGRSATLAGGSVKRLMALFVFSTVAAYSALAILYVPLAWYAWSVGVELMAFDAELIPAWYEIAYNMIWQISFILLSPVWTAGLCLLYVDERVRSEGYDIELMAARRLGEIPAVPRTYSNPLQPAIGSADISANSVPAPRGGSMLGLDQ